LGWCGRVARSRSRARRRGICCGSSGQTVVALKEAGAVKTSDAAYKNGARFLINTQLEDGSWFVRSRTIPFQPYFDAGFPYGPDQFISAAATNRATMALVPLAR